MYGEKIDLGACDLRRRALHRFADIVQLQIEKYAAALGFELAHKIHSGGCVKFQTHFIKRDGSAERRHQPARPLRRFEIERDNQGDFSFNPKRFLPDVLARGR